MLEIIFLLETVIITFLIYKYRLINVISLSILFFFIYGQSFYIDYLLFNQEYLYTSNYIHIFSDEYLYISLLYLTFILAYSLYPLISSRYATNTFTFSCNAQRLNIILSLSILAILFFLVSTYGFSRYEKIHWFQSHKLFTICLNIVGYIWIISILTTAFEKLNIQHIIFTLFFLMFATFTGGRELIVYIIITILFLKFEKVNTLILICVGLFLLLFLSVWKGFFFFVVMRGLDISGFIDWLDTYYHFSLTKAEPRSSIYLLYNYFSDEHTEFFNNFNFTYIENIVGQFLRTIGIITYPSIGEQIAEYFLNTTEKGKGLAFSGILESILNFGYFGPAIMGFLLGYISKKIDNLRSYNNLIYKIASVFFIIIMMKLTRTELAVVLKIYAIPMLIAYFIMHKLVFDKKSTHAA